MVYCLPGQNRSSEKDIQYFLKIITLDPSIHLMNHPDLHLLTVSNFMENPLVFKGLIIVYFKPWTS